MGRRVAMSLIAAALPVAALAQAGDTLLSDFLLRAYLETNPIKELGTHEIDQITKRLAKLIEDNEAVIADMAAGQLFAYEFGKNMYQTQLNFLHRYLETEIRRSNP